MIDFRFICLNLESFNQNGYYKFDPNLFKNKFQNACLNPLIDSRYLKKLVVDLIKNRTLDFGRNKEIKEIYIAGYI